MVDLKELRIKKGLTQEQLAEKCDVFRTTISMIENGNNLPSVELAKKIANVLEIEWKEFFE